MNFLKLAALGAAIALSACATNPGGFTKQLQPVDVAGHTVYTVTASSWMKTCFGSPDQVTTMMSQFQHQKGDRYLTHIGSGVVIAEGDCNALLKALGMIGGGAAAGALAPDQVVNTTATASTSTDVNVVVGGGYGY